MLPLGKCWNVTKEAPAAKTQKRVSVTLKEPMEKVKCYLNVIR